MARGCLNPIKWENIQNGLSINIIITEMLANHKRIIEGHIQKYLDSGGELCSLSLASHEDGTLILRSDQRTIVTVRINIDGRKVRDDVFDHSS